MGLDDIRRLEGNHEPSGDAEYTINGLELAACIPPIGGSENDHAHINIVGAVMNEDGNVVAHEFRFVLSMEMLDQFALGISDLLEAIGDLKTERAQANAQSSSPLLEMIRSMMPNRAPIEEAGDEDEDEPDIGAFRKYL